MASGEQAYTPLNTVGQDGASGPTDEDFCESERVEGADEEIAIALTGDAYDAVIAAAFDGIRITLPSDENGRRQFIRLHPIAVLLFCGLLFTIQMSCLSCLVLDMDLGNIWGEEASWEGFDDSPERKMKLVVKSIMVAVLQLIGMKELLGSMRPMCMVFNPITWFELQRPSAEGRGILFHGGVCAPICMVAQMMQFAVAYYVLTISMSVIIVATSVKDVIFNGLVVTFLADLDEVAWGAMSAVLHMDQKKFDEFQFQLKDSKDVLEAAAAAGRQEEIRAKKIAKKVSDARAEAKDTWKYWLYRGKGGKASVLENIFVFFFLAIVYIRQLFMYVQAIDTGILPVARDVCSAYRGLKEPGHNVGSAITLKVVDFFTLIEYSEMLHESVRHEEIRKECFTPEYLEGPWDHASTYFEWWPKQMWGGVIGIVLVFALPQVLYANFKPILEFLKSGKAAHDVMMKSMSFGAGGEETRELPSS